MCVSPVLPQGAKRAQQESSLSMSCHPVALYTSHEDGVFAQPLSLNS